MTLNAKEALKKIKYMDVQIDNIEKELEDLKNRMTGCKAISYDLAPGTARTETSPQERLYPIYDQGEKELIEQMAEFIEYKSTIWRTVCKMKNSTHIEILYKRYFAYMKWEEIAVQMNYSYQGVLKLHGRALQEFSKEYTQVYINTCYNDKVEF